MGHIRNSENYDLDVVLEWCGPSFESENRFIKLEHERIKKVLARHRQHGTAARIMARFIGESTVVWRRYDRRLASYEKSLVRHQQQLTGGILPFKVLIANLDSVTLHQVRLKLSVEHGEFDYAMTAPSRPVTPEGDKPYDKYRATMVLPVIGGFTRKHIQLGKTEITAEFSQLATGKDAFLVNQIVHLKTDEKTKLHFKLEAKELTGSIEGLLNLR